MAILQAGCLDMGYGKHTVTHQNCSRPAPQTHSLRFQEWVEGPQSASISHSVLEEIRNGDREHVFIRL